MLSPPASPLPYAQATPAQRMQALLALRQRLRHHFPTLSERAFTRALDEFRPDLLRRGPQLAFRPQDLTQLVQHLATSPELPLLDPPRYGLPALDLAQYVLHTSELAVQALAELVAPGIGCGPRLRALLQRLAYPYPLAERIVQAWRWDLASSPALPAGLPGGGPAPGSAEVQRLLRRLASTDGSGDG
ncbi:hypothetical protein [Hymenobacter psoromatis]|uniref:hypothetical protein n=1 Tax=Hymenobacter psoromatis TaxID=1484116 RepID=UPI001CC0DF04|nr:hypothetical protein [Hymenobacter psoromatis]